MYNNFFNIFTYIHFQAFHDCVGPNGCDGCVNTKQDDNEGLWAVITTLELLRKGILPPILGHGNFLVTFFYYNSALIN